MTTLTASINGRAVGLLPTSPANGPLLARTQTRECTTRRQFLGTWLLTGGKSMGIPLLFSSSTVSFKGPNSPVTMGAFFRTSRMWVIVDMIPSLSSAFFVGHGLDSPMSTE